MQEACGGGFEECGAKVPDITWEEELLLCGVRPGSHLVPVLHLGSASPRTHCRGNSLLSSTNKRAAVNGDDGREGGLQVKPLKRISSLRNISARLHMKDVLTSPACESLVAYSSDGGLSTTTQGRVMPLSLVSPRVVVPSLMGVDEDVTRPPQSSARKKLFHASLLPPLGSPAKKKVETPHQHTRKSGRLSPLRPFTTTTIPIHDTEATLVAVRRDVMQCSWPPRDNTAHPKTRDRPAPQFPTGPPRLSSLRRRTNAGGRARGGGDQKSALRALARGGARGASFLSTQHEGRKHSLLVADGRRKDTPKGG